MFLGLAVFIILAIVVSIIVIRAVKALFRLLTGGKKEDKGNEQQSQKETEKKSESKKEAKKEAKEESKSESEQLEKTVPQEEEDPSVEITRRRFADACFHGITEEFATGENLMEIDPKTVADLCVGNSAITYLEFNNREIAGEEYYGFNLIVEKDTRMVLTYNGQAVASLTAVETQTTAIINGQEVEGTMPGFRINTFPPTLTPGMVPSDLEKMLSAAERVRACGNDPRLVADCMIGEFTEPGNVSKLKSSIDSKIQAKESARKQSQKQGQTRKPRNLTPSPK